MDKKSVLESSIPLVSDSLETIRSFNFLFPNNVGGPTKQAFHLGSFVQEGTNKKQNMLFSEDVKNMFHSGSFSAILSFSN